MKETTKYANDIARQDNEAALAMLKKSGRMSVVTLSPQERGDWKRAMVTVHDKMAPRIGKEFIESIYDETGFEVAK